MYESLHNAKKTVLTIAFLILLQGEVSAQDTASMSMPTIRVAAEATVVTAPDQAQVNIGVVTEAENARDAAAGNAQELAAVLAKLRETLGSAAEIKTVGYSLHPKYQHPKQGGEPRIVGYMATNTVEVTTNELDQVGNIIGVATATGANRIQQLRFTLEDEIPFQAEALRQAAVRARKKAEAIASALDLETGRILAVEEGIHSVTPILMRSRQVAMAEVGATPTPVEPGTIEVRATVTLTIEIAQ
jgi:hypothetical protein